jgi:flagellar motor switch protein FliN
MPNSQSTQIRKIELPAVSNNASGNESDKPIITNLSPLYQVKAKVVVLVGNATITVGELLSAKENHVLLLDRGVNEPIELLIEGQVIARGQLVAVGDKFGVKITEAPVALGLQNGE